MVFPKNVFLAWGTWTEYFSNTTTPMMFGWKNICQRLVSALKVFLVYLGQRNSLNVMASIWFNQSLSLTNTRMIIFKSDHRRGVLVWQLAYLWLWVTWWHGAERFRHLTVPWHHLSWSEGRLAAAPCLLSLNPTLDCSLLKIFPDWT